MKHLLQFATCLLCMLGQLNAQYSETFDVPNKGILAGPCTTNDPNSCANSDFAGVDWTLEGNLSGLVAADDNFYTVGGVLRAMDVDEEVCWRSPMLNMTGTASFSMDLAWLQYDDYNISAEGSKDYIDVSYRIDGGSWITLPNAVGGGPRTISYVGMGGNIDGSISGLGASGLTGSTLEIRVCVDVNSAQEITTIDNVTAVNAAIGSVCDIDITNVAITDEGCPGANDGTLTVTATCASCAGGNADIRYSLDNSDFSNTTGVFTGLADGDYTVYVRDVNDIGCTDSDGPHTVAAGVDSEAPIPDASIGDSWAEAAKALASDGAAADEFGVSVAISGDYAIVGAPGDIFSSGSAYIFHRSGSSWAQQAKLTASDAGAFDEFGISVAISGDYAIVGAWFDDSFTGSAYIFARNGSNWTEQVKLTASDAAEDNEFGRSVAISGDYAIVGARFNNGNGPDSGSAYIFERNGSSWTEQVKLTASDAAAGDFFGTSVALGGDYAIVGASGDDDNGPDSGSAYIFERAGSSWTERAKLTASDGAVLDQFGNSVAISGDHAIVGVRRDDDNGDSSGSAYIFQGSGSNWAEQAKLTASDAAANDQFGISVAISGDHALVGALFNNNNGNSSGSVYSFVRNGSGWTQQTKLTASDAAGGDRFGVSVAISGDYAIFGADGDNDNGPASGSTYFFGQVPGDLPAFTAECSATPPTPTATDNCAGTISGTTTAAFPITEQGTTTITWTYNDGDGNVTTQEQDIILEDVTAPVITCPMDITVQATSLAGAVVDFADATATDNCGVAAITQTEGEPSGSTFAAGLHTIVFEATDVASNTASCSFTIEVEALVSVSDVGASGQAKLYQNVPNPFGETTRIGFELPEATEVKLRITDVSGREIQLIEGRYAAGYHEVEVYDLPARGLFFYQLQAERFTATLKMVRK